ncbi:MAG: hypothetical protein IBX68_06490 [Dehalococcoidia bacterium]|nr:hypothetical protein [Dehalococcoidia bacterium]
MDDAETREIETIRALVEYTWKQENIDRISAEIREYIERIVTEVREQIAGRVLPETIDELETRIAAKIRGEIRDILQNEFRQAEPDMNSRELAGTAVIQRNRVPAKVLLALGLSFAGIGIGIAIAALAGLMR